MTGRELLALFEGRTTLLAAYFAGVPIFAFVFGLLVPRGRGNDAPWKYVWLLVVYAACVPGICGAIVTAWFLLFSRENLLDQNLLLTVAPTVSMVVALLVAARRVDFGPLPGFGRISGLMTLIALTFLVLFALSRLHLLVIFGGSIFTLIALGAFVFALLKWGAYMAFRRRDEPQRAAPRFPGAE